MERNDLVLTIRAACVAHTVPQSCHPCQQKKIASIYRLECCFFGVFWLIISFARSVAMCIRYSGQLANLCELARLCVSLYTYVVGIYTYQQIGHSCDSISFMCALCFSVALCVCIIFAFLFPIQSPHRMNGDDGDDCDDDDVGNATKATMYAMWLCLCMCTELYDTLYRGYSCRSSVLRMRKRFAIIESPVW